MKKNIVIIGLVILIIGIVLAASGPYLFTKSPQSVAANTDKYSTGDTVMVYGRITDEKHGSILGTDVYRYELNGDGDMDNDGDLIITSSGDIGNVGDNVVAKLELKNPLDALGVSSTKFWEVNMTASPVIYEMPGIIVAVIGVIILLAGVVKKENASQQPVQNQYNPQYQQQQPYQQTQNYAPQPEYYPPQEQNNQGPPTF